MLVEHAREAVLCLLIGFSLAACASEVSIFDAEGWTSIRSQSGGQLTFTSGFDGANDYQVPLAFVGPITETDDFQVVDAGVASFVTSVPVESSQVPLGVTVTAVFFRAEGVGATAVEGTLNGVTFSAELIVNSYTPEDVELGTERYNNPANPNSDSRRSCASCHDELQAHSTAFLADLSDEEILRTAVDGIGISIRDPETGEVREYMPNKGVHRWDVTAEERVGIAAYLRSRPPLYQLPTQ